MAEIIEMPKLSDTMTTGTLVQWLKAEGDTVQSGDMLAEVETDKATMEVENFVDGVLLKHYVPAGSEVPIGGAMCAVGQPGEQAPEITPATPKLSDKAADQDTAQTAVSAAPQAAHATPQPSPPPTPTPMPTTATLDLSQLTDAPRIKASPLARKIAAEHGVTLIGLKGTGPGNRILKDDVLQALQNGTIGRPSPYVAPLGTPIAATEAVPVSNMRAAIARRLVESKTQAPHFYLETEIDAQPLIALRTKLNQELAHTPPAQGGIKLTINDFILKAVAKALGKAPTLNASWQGDAIQQYGQVHIAFGVAVADGLLTPVIRDAHAKDLWQISAEAKALIKRTRAKQLSPADMSGSTFTVTNLGMYGIRNFFGIINPPNAAILAVGATERKPVIDKNGHIVPGDRMALSLSADHRAVDGASGATFLSALKELLETPAFLLLS